MSSKLAHEGYLLIDHRESPGIPDEVTHSLGLPLGSGRGMFETATFTCNHCTAVVVMNPLRTRAREYCAKCNHYICDRCGAVKAATGECKTFNQIVEETQEAAVAAQL